MVEATDEEVLKSVVELHEWAEQSVIETDLSKLAICNGQRVAIDTETTGLHWWRDNLIGVGVSCPDVNFEAYYVTQTTKEREAIAQALKELWGPDTWVFAHNLKFDFHFLDIQPKESGWNYLDTTVLIHLIDSRYRKKLETAEEVFLKDTTKKLHVEAAPAKTKIWDWPIDILSKYCVNDARVTYALAKKLVPIVDKLGLWSLLETEMEYLNLLWDMEFAGALVDQEYVAQAKQSLQDRLDILVKELYAGVGYEFNWRSHQQLSKALYEDMGVAKPKNPFADADGVDRSRFADSGKYNSTMTSTFILMEKAHHPLGELISSIRETHKFISSYIGQWQDLIDEHGLLHTNYNLTGTRTGRISSKKPNLQNIPSEVRGRFTQAVFSGETTRSEEYNLRKALIAHEGCSFVATDWKQMEMRMFGLLSQDPFMLDSLAAGRDIHADIAEAVWGVRDKVHREWSKTISFGLIYGMTVGSVQFKLNKTRDEATAITEQYWNTFPKIRPWLFEQVDECKKFGYVRYWNGRLWHEEDKSYMYKSANAKIQGGCAGVLALAALQVDKEWLQVQNQPPPVNLVHDEIIVEVPDALISETARVMRDIMWMYDLFDLGWPTDCKVGKSYGDLHKWDVSAGTFAITTEEQEYLQAKLVKE